MQSNDATENKASVRESYRHQPLPAIRTDGGPPVRTDGGRDETPERDSEFELTLEYTTMDGRRQRVVYVPATDVADDARRITHERHDGEWRETGRQLISNLVVQLQNQPGRSGDYYAGP